MALKRAAETWNCRAGDGDAVHPQCAILSLSQSGIPTPLGSGPETWAGTLLRTRWIDVVLDFVHAAESSEPGQLLKPINRWALNTASASKLVAAAGVAV